MFVKECFEKKKLDSKVRDLQQQSNNFSQVRLHAKVIAVEKYGGSNELVERMTLYLEKKLEEDRQAALELAAKQAEEESRNP